MLYGATSGGGSSDAGTAYTVNKDGSGYAVLHQFTGLDGSFPHCGLLEASDGLLYGAVAGGVMGAGVVFSMAKDGTGYTVLYNFGLVIDDPRDPRAAVIEGADGALYGTTVAGGSGHGTVYKINKDGTGLVILHQFAGAPSDGEASFAPVIFGSDGALYGTAWHGGASGGFNGVVFQLTLN